MSAERAPSELGLQGRSGSSDTAGLVGVSVGGVYVIPGSSGARLSGMLAEGVSVTLGASCADRSEILQRRATATTTVTIISTLNVKILISVLTV